MENVPSVTSKREGLDVSVILTLHSFDTVLGGDQRYRLLKAGTLSLIRTHEAPLSKEYSSLI